MDIFVTRGKLWVTAVGMLVLVSVIGVTSLSNEPDATASNRGLVQAFNTFAKPPSPTVTTTTQGTSRRSTLGTRKTSTTGVTAATTAQTSTTTTPITTVPPPTVATTQTTSPTSTTATSTTSTDDSSDDPSGAALPGAIPGWTETFTDDFASPSSLSNYTEYGDLATDPDGSGSCFSASHDVVTGGELVIRGYQDPAAIAANGCVGDTNQIVTGGLKLTTNSQLYGKYEVRMRMDNGQGVSLVAALWPTSDAWPPEIDFTEDNGAAPRALDTATEHWGTWESPSESYVTLPVDLSQWHTVGVEWTPGKIVYTMDGTPWATETNANVSDVPMQLALQTEAWQCGANSWEQCANSSTPAEVDMDVAWIAVYSMDS